MWGMSMVYMSRVAVRAACASSVRKLLGPTSHQAEAEGVGGRALARLREVEDAAPVAVAIADLRSHEGAPASGVITLCAQMQLYRCSHYV